MEPYIECIKKNTEFFSAVSPDEILGEVVGYFEDK
jgi:hypothetical protein